MVQDKIKNKNKKRPAQSRNDGDADQPGEPAVRVLNVEVNIVLKYLSKFWIFLDLALINCEQSLIHRGQKTVYW